MVEATSQGLRVKAPAGGTGSGTWKVSLPLTHPYKCHPPPIIPGHRVQEISILEGEGQVEKSMVFHVTGI